MKLGMQLGPGHIVLDDIRNSGRSNLTLGRIAAAHQLFSRIRQVVLMCTHESQIKNASWAQPSPHPKRNLVSSTVFALTAEARGPYTLQWAPLSPSKLPICMVDVDLPSKT